MKNLEAITKEQADGTSKEIFGQLEKKMGMIPNVYATIGNSGVALKTLLEAGETLGKGEFSGKETEAIALAAAQTNSCGYCLAAHTAIGKGHGLSEEETVALRNGHIEDQKLKALTTLTSAIVETRGAPDQKLIDKFFEVGYSKAAFSELIIHVGMNTITNYVNHMAKTEIDFPVAPELTEA